MIPNPGMFSFASQTGPTSDPMSGSSWDTTGEGSQNFQSDFLETGSSHLGDEDFSFLDGAMTPRGHAAHAAEDLQSKWAGVPAAPAAVVPVGGEPMRRGTSRTSTGSHKHRVSKTKTKMTSASSQVSSRLSNLDMSGNAVLFNGSRPAHLDMNQCLFTSGVSNQVLFSEMPMDLPLGADVLPSPPTEMNMHVVPAHMTLDLDHSPSASWASLSTPESHFSSPAGSPNGTWMSEPLMASPPRSDNASPILGAHMKSEGVYSSDLMSADLGGSMMTMIADEFGLPTAFPSRRSTDGESARDHPLYKDAKPSTDGLFHCPWEGDASCNHKPEKLKCNYDKFVDSHLKPYRCKDQSCENARFSSTACLLRHEREAHAMHGHGDKPFLCSYDGCDRSMPGNGFPRQWNLRDHMRRVHNDNRMPGSPTGTGHSQQPAKGRKRKDAPKAAAPSRKASTKAGAVEAAARETQSQRPLLEEWTAHRKALEDIVRDMSMFQDTKNGQLYQAAQDQIAAMMRLDSHGAFSTSG
ncbi:hypothetical protein F5X68DRAFT_134185 [Plectosphaerella plurivora]|uniref:C2H2-type domain-containing protein n=1 Tax=Plectosphaerella plurivora TaxID=936078 RepID=A0A9P8VDY9_9PEZI|nr:hypothetical protein F5X68DRAFT_134185 [Plectosphaerella plurivora]